jgi:hypothetical protein
MAFEMKPLACDPKRLRGLSEKLIVSHYENNYGGAVKRLGAITAQLEKLDFAAAPPFVVNGLKRERRPMSTPSWTTSTGRTSAGSTSNARERTR